MEIIMFVALGAVGLLAFVSVLRGNEKVGGFSYLLTTLSLLMIVGELTPGVQYGNVLYLSATLFSTFFILAHLNLATKWWVKLMATISGLVAIVAFADTLTSGEYMLEFNNLTAVLLLVFAMAAPFIMTAKLHLFDRFLGEESRLLRHSLQLFIIGFAFFLGSFLFALPGVLLIAIGFTASSFFVKEQWRNVSVALLLMAIMLATMEYAGLSEVDLSMGKVVLGIFFGAFLTFFTHAFSSQNKPVWWMLLLASMLTFGLTFLFVVLGTQKADLGGADAFVGSLVGLVMALLALKENAVRDLVVMAMLLAGLSAISLTLSKENKGQVEFTKKTEVVINAFDSAVNAKLEGLDGAYTIDSDSFRFDFELGPKGGRTKGAFKEIEGSVELGKDAKDVKFAVVLPIRALTTFNKFRDESLMSDEYFSAEKFGHVSFNATGLEDAEGAYILKGKFTMLGVEKELMVQLKYKGEENGKPVFIGKGAVDRRDFGMRSDPKEGNVVDFEFEIALLKK
jgi:polyisoprenoid-binding protein YceI